MNIKSVMLSICFENERICFHICIFVVNNNIILFIYLENFIHLALGMGVNNI